MTDRLSTPSHTLQRHHALLGKLLSGELRVPAAPVAESCA